MQEDAAVMRRSGWRPGEQNRSAKLNARQVLEIRRDDRSIRAIARQYKITPGHVCKIQLKQRWKHLADEAPHAG